jgi:hypothetical protein
MGISAIVLAVVGLLAIVVLFALARRALRLVVKLALFGLVLLALAVGGILFWWNGGLSSSQHAPETRTPSTRRAPAR